MKYDNDKVLYLVLLKN